MDLQKRYSDALKQIGGAEALLSLPKSVQDILKSTTDLEAKVKILEMVAFYTEAVKAEEEAEKEEPCEYCRMIRISKCASMRMSLILLLDIASRRNRN